MANDNEDASVGYIDRMGLRLQGVPYAAPRTNGSEGLDGQCCQLHQEPGPDTPVYVYIWCSFCDIKQSSISQGHSAT